MSRKDRYGIGERMRDCTLDMMDNITLAYLSKGKKDRLDYLDKLYMSFVRLQTYLRICLDFTVIKLGTLTKMHIIVDDISKQYGAWKNKTSRMES